MLKNVTGFGLAILLGFSVALAESYEECVARCAHARMACEAAVEESEPLEPTAPEEPPYTCGEKPSQPYRTEFSTEGAYQKALAEYRYATDQFTICTDQYQIDYYSYLIVKAQYDQDKAAYDEEHATWEQKKPQRLAECEQDYNRNMDQCEEDE